MVSKQMLLQITNPSVSMMLFAQVELCNDPMQFLDGMFGCYLEFGKVEGILQFLFCPIFFMVDIHLDHAPKRPGCDLIKLK